MFGDPHFESKDQSDFYILDKRQKIYVKYDYDTEVIEKITIHSLDGDMEKIRSLGELMLPDDFVYLTENYRVKERKMKLSDIQELNLLSSIIMNHQSITNML